MTSTMRYKRAFCSAVAAFKDARASRKMPWDPSASEPNNGKVAPHEKARTEESAGGRDINANATSVAVRVNRKKRQSYRVQDAIEKARREAVRAHFAACKVARADSVRQARQAAADASFDTTCEESNANEVVEASIRDAERTASSCLIGAFRKVALSIAGFDNRVDGWDLGSDLAQQANDAHSYATRVAKNLESAQQSAKNANRSATLARAWFILAKERAEGARDQAVELALEAYLAAFIYARIRSKKGLRSERTLARSQMKYAAHCIQAIGNKRSQNLARLSRENQLLGIAGSGWTVDAIWSLFKLSKYLWESVFLILGFAVNVVRTRRLARKEEKAESRARAAADANQNADHPKMRWADRAEYAFRFGAIDQLTMNVELSAEEEAEDAAYARRDAEKHANMANLHAALSWDMVDFSEYCAVRADLLEARFAVDSSGKVTAPETLGAPIGSGGTRTEVDVPNRAYNLFARAQVSAAKSLARAKEYANRLSFAVGEPVVPDPWRGSYARSRRAEIDRRKKPSNESSSSTGSLVFVEVRRAIRRADLAGCSAHAAGIVSELSWAASRAEDASRARSNKEIRSIMKDAFFLCEAAVSSLDWAEKDAAKAEKELAIHGDAAEKMAGVPGGFPTLREYAKEAKARIQPVIEAFERAVAKENADLSIRETRVLAKSAANAAYEAAKIEHDARRAALSGLLALHRDAIVESLASFRARERAFLDRLNYYIVVAERTESVGAGYFQAAGQEYRIERELAEQAKELAARVIKRSQQKQDYFGTPWHDEYLEGELPEQLAKVVEYCNTKWKKDFEYHRIACGEETDKDHQRLADKAKASIEILKMEMSEMAQLINGLEEIYQFVQFFQDTYWIAKSARDVTRQATGYDREARVLDK